MKFCIYFCILALAAAEMTAPGIYRVVSDNVHSVDFKLLYGDEDMSVLNEVLTQMDKNMEGKSKYPNWQSDLQPLHPEDVKCLMSIDRHCSKEMGETKRVLISAVKEDCSKCTSEEKEKAGKVAAAMMAHDSVAWKMFLTRLYLQTKPRKPRQNVTDEIKFKLIGRPEEIPSSKYRYTYPGFHVKVKRYNAVKLP